jgi:hypothetical protein
MPGDVFCRNLAQRLKLPPDMNHNLIDACGIAFAASQLTAAELKKHRPKGFQ